MNPAPQTVSSQNFSETVSSQDRGLLYGDGLFETIRFFSGRLLLWEPHRQRLLSGCDVLGIDLDLNYLDSLIPKIIASAPSTDCILKVIVTRGTGGRGYTPPSPIRPTVLFQWYALASDIVSNSKNGIDVIFCRHPLSVNPVTAGIKHLNRLDQVLASRELSDAALHTPTVREGLMLDLDSNLIEGTRSNVFVVVENQLCTPELTRCGIDGVMRNRLIELLASNGVEVVVRTIQHHELKQGSEAFLCNSVFGVWPILRLIDAGDREEPHEFCATTMARMAQQLLSDDFPL
jgi:4-amino-4-deoxychorismate lyase